METRNIINDITYVQLEDPFETTVFNKNKMRIYL